MRRHLLIGTFGPNDNASFSSATDEQITKVSLVSGNKTLNNYLQKVLEGLRELQIFPSEIGVDLIILAVHVHAADTRISRSSESQDSWTREIRLLVPVSNPTLWTSTSTLLSRILNFLTGDKWIIGFRSRPSEFSSTVPINPNNLFAHPFDVLSLFSGGLDSLTGAIDLLDNGKIPLLISHAGEGATSDAQNTCFNSLKKYYKEIDFHRLRLWLNFPKNLIRKVQNEDTTRGRSFLFFALGVLAGTGFNKSFILEVPENGLIALNVPLDSVRLGSLSTRTTHPFYMARWNELLSLLNINGKIENPYWNKTKGEMVKECSNLNLIKNIIPSSLSCSSPSKGRWKGKGIEHCGYCLPCLIRRSALEFALEPGNDPTKYTINNLKAEPLNTLRSEGQQVRSFQIAIERLRQKPDLYKLLIHKSGSLADESENLSDLADVYLRGMNEVSTLLDGVKTRPN